MKQKTHLVFGEILKLASISERTFRYRIAELKIKYKDSPELMYKKRNKWKIHVSLLEEFNNKHFNKN